MEKEVNAIYKYGLLFLSFILIIPIAFAQGFFDFLYFTDLSSLYQSGFEWWDFFIYLTIFGSLARIIFEKRFQRHKSADLLAVGVATALSLSLVYYETSVLGQSLIMLGGYTILIVASLLLGLGVFLWVKNKFGMIGGFIAAILIFLLFPYILRSVPSAQLPDFIENPLTDFGPILILLLIVGLVLSWAGKIKAYEGSSPTLGDSGGSLPYKPGRDTGHVKNWWPFKKKPKQAQQQPQPPGQQPQANQQQIIQAISNMKDHLEHISDRSAQLNILIGRVLNDSKKFQATDPAKTVITSVSNYRINPKSYQNIKNILKIIGNPNTKDADKKSALVLLENSLSDILNSAQNIMKILGDNNNAVDNYLRNKNVKFRIYLIAKYIGQLSSQLIPYCQKIRNSIP